MRGGGQRQGRGPQPAPRAADEDLPGRLPQPCLAQQPGQPPAPGGEPRRQPRQRPGERRGQRVRRPSGTRQSFVWTGDTAGQGWGINPDLGGYVAYRAMHETRPDFFVHAGDTIYADNPIYPEARATGGGTWFGQLAGRVSEQESEPNAFQKGISRVSMLLIRFMLVMTPIVLLINGYTKGDWWEAALFALSVAVGLTPEMLPMIVTSTLARGAVKLSKQKVIVKHLDAIQNFGAMDILCTDKTGTLTQDKIVLENHTDVSGKVSERVLHTAWLNSHYQTGLKNLLDTAVLEGVELESARGLAERWQTLDPSYFAGENA